MTDSKYEVLGRNYPSTSRVPKDEDIFYQCDDCGDVIPSVPDRNIGCKCGNVFIDKDYWRLIVADLAKMTVLRKLS